MSPRKEGQIFPGQDGPSDGGIPPPTLPSSASHPLQVAGCSALSPQHYFNTQIDTRPRFLTQMPFHPCVSIITTKRASIHRSGTWNLIFAQHIEHQCHWLQAGRFVSEVGLGIVVTNEDGTLTTVDRFPCMASTSLRSL